MEIKNEGRKPQGRLVAVDGHLNIPLEETIGFVDNQRRRNLGKGVMTVLGEGKWNRISPRLQLPTIRDYHPGSG